MNNDKEKRKAYLKRSFIFFKGLKGKIFVLTLFYIFIGLSGFFSPLIEAQLITTITSESVIDVIKVVGLFFSVVTIEAILWYLTRLFWRKQIRTKILFNIRKELLDNVFELRLSNFDRYQTGMFQERVKTDPTNITRVVNMGQNDIMQFLTKIGVIIYVLFINWILGLIYVTGIIIVTLVDNYFQVERKEKNKKVRQSDEEVNSILSEVIRGIRDIKLLNFKSNIKNLMMKRLDNYNELSNDKDNYESKHNSIRSIILYITLAIVLIVGINFVKLGFISSSNLIVLFLYNGSIFSLMESFSHIKGSLKEYELAVERIFDLEDEERYPRDSFGNVHIDNFKGKIEFEKVSFGYIKSHKVLNELSFTIKPKATVALVGSSGSGKTTIFNLLTKSYLVDSGIIKLDDIDINKLDEDTIRKNISIITQNPYIFNMSIKDNLKLVKPNATKEELDRVCKEACFYDYVMNLPKKYNTIIGEGGVNLSGGQRQRLAIARALLKDCKILLFDEATSALDNITQKEIQESIEHISPDYTIIVVAHRLSTIINCNPIYILKEGRIIDSGTHKQLLKRNKDYKSLYEIEK